MAEKPKSVQINAVDENNVVKGSITLLREEIDLLKEERGYLAEIQELYASTEPVLNKDLDYLTRINNAFNEVRKYMNPLLSDMDGGVDSVTELHNLLQGISAELRGTTGTLQRAFKFDRDILGLSSQIRSMQLSGHILSSRETKNLEARVRLQSAIQDQLVTDLHLRSDINQIKALGDAFGEVKAQEKLNELLNQRVQDITKIEGFRQNAIANKNKALAEKYSNDIKALKAEMAQLQSFDVGNKLRQAILREDMYSREADRFVFQMDRKLKGATFGVKVLAKMGLDNQTIQNFKDQLEEAMDTGKMAYKQVLETAPTLTGETSDIQKTNTWLANKEIDKLAEGLGKDVAPASVEISRVAQTRGGTMTGKEFNDLIEQVVRSQNLQELSKTSEDFGGKNLYSQIATKLRLGGKGVNSAEDLLGKLQVPETAVLKKGGRLDTALKRVDTISAMIPEIAKALEDRVEKNPEKLLGDAAVSSVAEAKDAVSNEAKKTAQKVFDELKPTLKGLFAGLDWKQLLFAGLGISALDIATKVIKGVTGFLKGIVTRFGEVSAEAAKVKQLTGEWQIGLAASNSQFATTKDVLQAIQSLSAEISLNPTKIFSKKELGDLAEAKNLMGFTDKQAASLGVSSKITGQSIDGYRRSLGEGIKQGMGLNRTVVNMGTATREALEASDAIKISMGNNAQAIGRAVVAAKSLGMSLQDIEEISKNLMNFQSSIEAEMTAQLLTGRQLNLARARELALNNDLAGVAREIGKQGINMAEYGKMNYIQQENLAKALGMSRDQMAKMLITQQLSAGVSAKVIAQQMKMNEDQIRAVGIADNWKKAMEKLQESFMPILELLIPIVEMFSRIASILSSIIAHVFSLGGLVDKWSTSMSGWMGHARNTSGALGGIDKKYAKIAEEEAKAAEKAGLLADNGKQAANVAGTMEAGFGKATSVVMGLFAANTLLRKSFILIRSAVRSTLQDMKATLIGIRNLFSAEKWTNLAGRIKNFTKGPKLDKKIEKPAEGKKNLASRIKGLFRRGEEVNVQKKDLGKEVKKFKHEDPKKAQSSRKRNGVKLKKPDNNLAKSVENTTKTTQAAGAARPNALVRLGQGLKLFSRELHKVRWAAIGKAILAAAGIAAVVGGLVYACSLIKGIETNTLIALGVGLVGFIGILAVAGTLATASLPVLLGLTAVILAIGVSMIAFGYAATLFAKALEAVAGIDWGDLFKLPAAMATLGVAAIIAAVGGVALVSAASAIVTGALAITVASAILLGGAALLGLATSIISKGLNGISVAAGRVATSIERLSTALGSIPTMDGVKLLANNIAYLAGSLSGSVPALSKTTLALAKTALLLVAGSLGIRVASNFLSKGLNRISATIERFSTALGSIPAMDGVKSIADGIAYLASGLLGSVPALSRTTLTLAKTTLFLIASSLGIQVASSFLSRGLNRISIAVERASAALGSIPTVDGVRRLADNIAYLTGSLVKSAPALAKSALHLVVGSLGIRAATSILSKGLNKISATAGKVIESLGSIPRLSFGTVRSDIRGLADDIIYLSDTIATADFSKLSQLSDLPRVEKIVEPQGEPENPEGESNQIADVNKVLPALRAQVIQTEVLKVEPQRQTQEVREKERAGTNTKVIEAKMDLILQALKDTRPDWNWLQFDREYALHVPRGF